ncbi:MAG: lamin tail domain-containing protein, partial [Anaerolinea sp.]|nr:lamin tail domain-containing protein [Anaerolinea sp.]
MNQSYTRPVIHAASRLGLSGFLSLCLLVITFTLLRPDTAVTAPLATTNKIAVANPAILAVAAPLPTFSQPHGFYDAPFTLALNTTIPGAVIRYTLDHSAPSATSGAVYTAPLSITTTTVVRAIVYTPDNSFTPSPVTANSYFFINHILNQAGAPPGYPNLWSSYPADYDMDPEIVSSITYAPIMTDALLALPTLSIAMNVNDLFGSSTGIYTHPLDEGPAWERPSSVELIFPDGQPGFQINAGIRIFGGASRSPINSPKHSFRLLFKADYGPTKLTFPLFDDSATDEFDTLVLRAGYNNSWIHRNHYPAGNDQRSRSQYIRDRWANDSQLAMGQAGVHGTYVHLYINGLYWGVYNLQERPSAPFQAAYYGGDKEEYDVLNSGEVVDGDRIAWDTLISLAGNDLSVDANYQAVLDYIDLDNFIDFILLNHYAGNQDWDDHNWYAARRRAPGEKFRFFVWDSERILEDVNHNIIGVYLYDKPSYLFQRLRANSEFRLRFADRIYQHLYNDGALTPGPAADRFATAALELQTAVVAESARWGDYRRDVHPASYGPYELYTRDDHWLPHQAWLLDTYFPQRTAVAQQQFIAANLFPTLATPLFSQHGGDIMPGYVLTITNPHTLTGAIYYTLDGSDPHLPYGGPSAAAVNGGSLTTLSLPYTTLVKARIYNSATGEWSALHKALFRVPTDLAADLLISEIMYHPPEGEEYEFLELKNTGVLTLDLGLARLSEGIHYTFTVGTLLPPGAFIVLAADPLFFQTKYGFAPFNAAGYIGQLSNGGETVALQDVLGNPITAVTYDDASPWPVSPDGLGFSLVPIAPNSNPNPDDPANWRASAHVGGSPGSDDPIPTAAPVLINELLANSGSLLDWIELHNPLTTTVDLSNWYLTDDLDNPTRYQIPNGTVIPGGGYLVFDESQLGFAFKTNGEAAFLFSNDLSYSHGFIFGPSAEGVSFGRYVLSTGDAHYPAQRETTSGAANAGPLVGPIVISQIMYHPDAANFEFLVLTNITSQTVPLYDTAVPNNTWQITGLGDFFFPQGAAIHANSYAIVTEIAPSLFRTIYNVPAAIPIFGPYPGGLSNGGELISLQMPGQPGSSIPYIVVDEVEYDDVAPWPIAPDGNGPSLRRLDNAAYANDPVNWQSWDNWQNWPPPPAVDLGLSKTVTPATPRLPGQAITYTLHFSNAGPGTAVNVTLDDPFPLTLSHVTTGYSGAAISLVPGSRFTWNITALDPGSSGVITLTGIISPDLNTHQTITNTAVITTTSIDSNPANNTAQVSSAIILPLVSLSQSAYTVPENNGPGVITLTLTPAPIAPVTVTLATSDGTAVAGSDYIPITGPFIIPSGQTAFTVTIPILDETLVETDETVNVHLLQAQGAILTAPLTATLTISNDDSTAVQFSSATYLTNEAVGTAVITTHLTNPAAFPISVTVTTVDGTAVAGSDYSPLSSAITFLPLQTHLSVTISIINDMQAEADENLFLYLSDPVGATPGSPYTATLTISDDDQPGVAITPQALTLVEGEPGAGYAVILGSQPTRAVTVTIQHDDAITTTPSILTFTPLTWHTAQTVMVTAVDDAIPELPTTTHISHILTSLDPMYDQLPAAAIAVTIHDDDLPAVSFLSTTAVISETGGTAVGMAAITVTLDQPAPFTVTVNYATADGTAVAHSDYTPSSGTLTFLPGQTSHALTIAILDDALPETDESFFLHLSQPINAILADPALITVTIHD